MRINRRDLLKALGLAAAFPLPVLAQAEDTAVSFLQLTDTHVGSERGDACTRAVVQAMRRFSLPHDYVIHTGDIIEDPGIVGQFEKARAVLRFEKPAIFVPGNHDIGYTEQAAHMPTFEKMVGPCEGTVLVRDNMRFVWMNSQALDPRMPGQMRADAFNRLRQSLTPAMPTLVFCHHTGMPDFWENKMHGMWPAKILDAWTDVLKEGGVEAVLAGHYHRHELHHHNGVPFHIAGPIIDRYKRQPSFRHWTWRPGEISFRVVEVEVPQGT